MAEDSPRSGALKKSMTSTNRAFRAGELINDLQVCEPSPVPFDSDASPLVASLPRRLGGCFSSDNLCAGDFLCTTNNPKTSPIKKENRGAKNKNKRRIPPAPTVSAAVYFLFRILHAPSSLLSRLITSGGTLLSPHANTHACALLAPSIRPSLPVTTIEKNNESQKMLQDYISEVETIAENRGRELQKTKEQKHQLVSINKRLESGNGGAAAALNFDTLQGSEVPPKVRALIEDAKGMKVRCKKFKDQCAAHERTISSQQSQISKLQDKISALEGAVKKLEKDPETVLADLKNAAAATEKVNAAE